MRIVYANVCWLFSAHTDSRTAEHDDFERQVAENGGTTSHGKRGHEQACAKRRTQRIIGTYAESGPTQFEHFRNYF